MVNDGLGQDPSSKAYRSSVPMASRWLWNTPNQIPRTFAIVFKSKLWQLTAFEASLAKLLSLKPLRIRFSSFYRGWMLQILHKLTIPVSATNYHIRKQTAHAKKDTNYLQTYGYQILNIIFYRLTGRFIQSHGFESLNSRNKCCLMCERNPCHAS